MGRLGTRYESFNPRARVEPDAPRRRRNLPPDRFNPRARVEPDWRHAADNVPVLSSFQSTGSRGARLDNLITVSFKPGFNPRARVEPDEEDRIEFLDSVVSIHGLAWSPTGRGSAPSITSKFQSTGSRGARPFPSLTQYERSVSFNPRARVEPDFALPSPHPKRIGFQSTGSRGARRLLVGGAAHRNRFNPRARVEPDCR